MESAKFMQAVDAGLQPCGAEMEENVLSVTSDFESQMGGTEIEEHSPVNVMIPFDGEPTIEPCVGLEFDSEEGAYAFYSEYARRVGFFIRKKSTRYSRRDKTLIATQYVCSKEGFKRSNETVKNPRANTREGCKAMIRVKKVETGKWIVHVVEKDHNHVLVGPIHVHYLRTVRRKLEIDPHIGVAEMEELPSVEEHGGVEDVKVEPYVGMEFESEEACFLFYKEYARRVGFAIRKRSTRYSKRCRTLIATQYVCSKEGFKQINETVKHPRPNTREGCKAMVKVKRIESGKWIIHFVEKEHGHPLVSPANMQIIHSCGKLQPIAKHRVNNFHLLRSRPSKLASIGVSIDGVTQLERRCIDQMQVLTFAGGDLKVLMDYFSLKQAENPSFFYAVEVNEEEYVRNVLWADARSRMACDHFGDIVLFDTTYVMKKYQVPFAPFVGVNHHGQSVLLGCALLPDRTVSSVTWVFQNWLAALTGRHPKSIITEQDGAIQAAVAKVFPNTRHCFSMWHIQKEVLSKLDQECAVSGNFTEDFDNCVYQSETGHEFESKWDSLLNKFDLADNEWLQLFFEYRQQWVPVYLTDTFLAGFSTTKQNNNMSSFFDQFLSSKTCMKDFIDKFDMALESAYEKELCADLETFNTKPTFMTASPLERQAAYMYTGSIFKRFQAEICQTLGYYASKTKEEADFATYMVGKFDEEKSYTVTFHVSETRVCCSCHMFEAMGILCRHALRVFIAASVFTIPPPYILKRWTKDPWNRLAVNELPNGSWNNNLQSLTSRYNDLCQKSLKIAEVGAFSIESYNVALQAIQDAIGTVIAANSSLSGSAQSDTFASNQHKICLGSLVDNLADLEVQPLSKRLKTEFMKNHLRTDNRTCNICKSTSHNVCNCGESTESSHMEHLKLPMSISFRKNSPKDM